jgi:hypothetical protein
MDKNAKFIVTAKDMTAVLPVNTINEIFGVVN